METHRDVDSSPLSRFTEPAADAFVAIQLRYPLIRTILISGMDCPFAEEFAVSLVHVIASTGIGAKRFVLLDEVEKESKSRVDGLSSSADASPLTSPASGLRLSASSTDLTYVRSLVEKAATGGYVVASTEDFVTDRESLVLASVLDGVLLLAQSGRTTFRSLQAARSRVSGTATTLLGSVYVR